MLGLVEWLFSILLKKRVPSALVDATWGDPVALSIRTGLAASDFPSAERQLRQAADLQTLDHWVQACSDWDGRPAWLDDWVRQMPDSPFAYLLRGAHGTHWAWQARGARSADQTDEAAFMEFFRRLELAQADLETAMRLDPSSALPAAWTIRVLIGQQADIEHKRACFEQAIAHAPTLVSAHRAMLNASCAKWGGSDDLMLAFARQHAPRSPALQMLIPLAHIEAFIGIDDLEQRRAYARQGPVRAEVEQAFAHFRTGQDTTALRLGANAFAFQFVLAKDHKRAAQAFALSAGFVAPAPWMYIGDPLAMYNKLRATVS